MKGLLLGLLTYLSAFNKANIAAAVGFTASAILPTFFHVSLAPQDQLELSGILAVVLHQVVYWTANNKTATGDFGIAPASAAKATTAPSAPAVEQPNPSGM